MALKILIGYFSLWLSGAAPTYNMYDNLSGKRYVNRFKVIAKRPAITVTTATKRDFDEIFHYFNRFVKIAIFMIFEVVIKIFLELKDFDHSYFCI